ncbi:hypothetical protein HDU92_002810, partial [Lobulomyces angularis]
MTKKTILYVGTYNKGELPWVHGSREIQVVTIEESGPNPTYLKVSKDERYLYAINESDEGTISSFKIEKESGLLSFLNKVSSGTKGPCHLTVTADNKFLINAHYDAGCITTLKLNEDGSVGKVVETINFNDDKEKIKKSHAHHVLLSSNEEDLFICDLGLDAIHHQKFDKKTGKSFKFNTNFLETGDGPRHACFSGDDETFFHVITDILEEKEKLTFLKNQSAAAINLIKKKYINETNNFLILSTRKNDKSEPGKNLLILFHIFHNNNNIEIKKIDQFDSLGECPRDFNFIENLNLLFCGNQDSDFISNFKFLDSPNNANDTDVQDKKFEHFVSFGSGVKIGNPVCL